MITKEDSPDVQDLLANAPYRCVTLEGAEDLKNQALSMAAEYWNLSEGAKGESHLREAKDRMVAGSDIVRKAYNELRAVRARV